MILAHAPCIWALLLRTCVFHTPVRRGPQGLCGMCPQVSKRGFRPWGSWPPGPLEAAHHLPEYTGPGATMSQVLEGPLLVIPPSIAVQRGGLLGPGRRVPEAWQPCWSLISPEEELEASVCPQGGILQRGPEASTLRMTGPQDQLPGPRFCPGPLGP